ncbi:LysE family translocator [Puniceibacterium sediminis]|uniref:Threonine/homoserine/homoserine lactone efflux protein n=1 Tax=Puniceibacterium sediminis TaxID=1608407 RepID=A0A238XH20_9RHOB|nr:LysE family transporter [Puniceibacterium sediminis]SNR58000.1 Threonine/homoserine/homoserine lactone efflux protein [Puniceibacterium sediminis]
MTLAAFLTVVLIHLAAAMSPGPSFVVAARTAASEGFGTATALAFGFGLGAALWATAAMAGLALLFQLFPALFAALKIVGGAFLVWIAFQMWRHAGDPLQDRRDLAPRSTFSAVRLGFLTFATNPKTAVFFGAVFVGLVPADTPLAARAALLAAIFVNETLWYIVVARLFSLPKARATYIRAKAWIDRSFGLLIAGFGLNIALT